MPSSFDLFINQMEEIDFDYYAYKLVRKRNDLNKEWHGDVDKFRSILDLHKILLQMIPQIQTPIIIHKIKKFELN